MPDVSKQEWVLVATASYGNEWSDPPKEKICVVATRYGGGYEGGRFAAVPLSALSSAAFGQDLAASAWWQTNRSNIGVGNTPSDALADWFAKQGE